MIIDYNIYFKHNRISFLVKRWGFRAYHWNGLSKSELKVYNAILGRQVKFDGSLGDPDVPHGIDGSRLALWDQRGKMSYDYVRSLLSDADFAPSSLGIKSSIARKVGVHYCVFDCTYLPYSTGFSPKRINWILGSLWEKELIMCMCEDPNGGSLHKFEMAFAVFSNSRLGRIWYQKRYQDRKYERLPDRVPARLRRILGMFSSKPLPNTPDVIYLGEEFSETEVSEITCGVYLIKTPLGAWKIGKTGNIHDRLKTFSVKLPFEIELEHFIPTEDYHVLERDLHRRFSSKRLNGSEFFALSDEDIAFIKALNKTG